jgi:tRNA threonylcarbamoyladenosine modification (KEOPS) complex  Pcc1 subunit
MKIKSKIELEYKDSKDAEIIYKSLEVDNEGFVKNSLNENTIKFEIESNSLGSFLATADDLIASEILAENIIKNTNQ